MRAERVGVAAPRRRAAGVVLVALLLVVGGSGIVGAAGPVGAQSAASSTPGQPAVPTNPDADPVRARQQAEEVFAQDAYDHRTPRDSWVGKVFEWIGRQLAKLFDGVQAPSGGSGVNPASWLLVLALVAIVVFLVWRFRRTVRPKADAEAEVDIEVAVAQTRPSTDWIDDAARAEAAGEWRLGLQARFRALVAELIERGVVAALPGRTVGEFRAEVRAAAPEVGDTFAAAGTLFERAYYGAEPTGPAEAARFGEAAAAVIAAARAHERELHRARQAAAASARSPFETVTR